MARYIPRNLRGTNAGIGILLLIFMFVMAGPRTFSNLISLEGSCASLRRPSEPDIHQSLIQREASQRMTPIRVRVRVSGQRDDGSQVVTVVLTNATVGTLPIVIPNDSNFPDGRLDVNNQTSDGVGILVTGAVTLPTLSDTRAPVAYDQVRMLVPQQSCTVSRVLSAAEAAQAGLRAGAPVTGYYRNSTSGTITQRTVNSVFPDLGLWVGAVASQPVVVPSVFIPTQTPIIASAGG